MFKKITAIAASLGILLTTAGASPAQEILQEIQNTGTLKVGIRKDAVPFGYVESGEWEGLCIEMMESFTEELEQQFNRSIELQTLESTLNEASPNGRYRSVRDGRVHLECGPNTISTTPPQGTEFSTKFFVTGTYFLMRPQTRILFKPSGFLEGLDIGVLDNTLTRKFIESRYQLADPISYTGNQGRQQAIRDAMRGTIDAFASDGILLVGEAERQGLTSSQYSLLPNEPLTCISYGMILPSHDRQWIETVNLFIAKGEAINIVTRILTDLVGVESPYIDVTIAAMDKCS
ncbi:MAG: transporter substrate-binding domain-containing protein [Roseofilum sp. SBFL]|uniref:transporter substrate-binding domain-containing protein n=1 Tax=unclassified Roseofilum TaxID=2620099 RepID=UPI001B2AB6B3|nr:MULTISPECIES: transporter substrate-binding domain-containing protein [unclassified Roseofilum]MBP0012815.1 transporter substrate-binding domain-containing protein [Roseofilum sp. SID3]MBP0025193.1 transporter substrate-binding domain-containing protein [Roseofilum sp. SID2]MBP0039807.1 transporter substrate-binding domain-containing protein [Roseofilum sp. SID1]MBP0044380.1 transporter substrate-binding domain-containing protein [Roseofilum sp. SBFL]